MFDLTGKRALVTGASGGIGREIAKALAAAGAKLALSGTRVGALEEVANEVGGAAVLPCNLADLEAVDKLVGQAAAVALTALSASTLAAYLAALASTLLLKLGLVTMAVLDAILVFGQLLQGPNQTLVDATPGGHLPHLQAVTFGTAMIGYGDVFVAAVLGNIVVHDATLRARVRPWQAALLTLVCAAAFDALFLVVDVLPATVPVAIALLLIQACSSRPARA